MIYKDILLCIFPERLFTFLAHKDHLKCLTDLMILFFLVAFWAIVPLAAARRSDGDLCDGSVCAIFFLFVFRKVMDLSV